MRWRVCLLVVVAALLANHKALAMDTERAFASLDAMSRSFRELNYRGVFTYEQGQSLSSLRILHAVVDGIERERIVHLDGDEREFVRSGHRIDCMHTGDELVRLDPSAFTRGLHQPVARLQRFYAITPDGVERVANRSGYRLRINPRDPYRYGMRLVLDQASSLLLKSETMDHAGRVLERFQFVEVEIGGHIDEQELRPETPRAHVAEHAQREEPATGMASNFDWTVSWLPEGFELAAREIRSKTGLSTPVESAIYTDGLAVFSIFVEKEPGDSAQAGHASRGATVAYTVPRGDKNAVTVVGEIPLATAELVANSVNFEGAAR